MANFGNDVTLIPAGTVVTAAGTSATVLEPDNKSTARLALVITAASGTTPSITINIQTSFDSGVTDAWRTIGSYPAQTAAGTVRQSFAGLDRFVRAQWAAPTGTTPSFTLGISGEVV